MKNPYEKLERLQKIFIPTASERTEKLISENGKLAHYTTAENALKIIKNREIWLRNARAMQDYSELHQGLMHLRHCFSDPTIRERLDAAFAGLANDVLKDAMTVFGNQWDQLQAKTYLACFSEHLARENSRGRLSMWRAFGKNVPSVAIILNCPK